MDPITVAIIWAVIWFAVRSVGAVAVFLAVFGISAYIASATDKGWIAFTGAVLAYIAAFAFEVWAVVMAIREVVVIVELIAQSA